MVPAWYWGLGGSDFALLILRLVLGVFFLLARFRWFWDPSRKPELLNPERHQHLTWKLCWCGYHWHPLMAVLVASTEVFGGIGLILGLLTLPSALGLLTVLLFATVCTATTKVQEQNPVDMVDCVSCYLWRVEGMYIAVAFVLLLLGPGRISLDYLFFG